MIDAYFHFGDFELPLLAFAIHNGHHIPAELTLTLGIDDATCLREEDPFTDGFAARFANRVVVNTSRFAVDLNRNRENCVYLQPEDAWGLPVRSAPLPDELQEKLREAYDTWYRLVACEIDRILQTHPRLLVLDLHSFNHRRGGPDAEPDPQMQNPDIILGRNILPASSYPVIEKLRERLDGKTFAGKALDCRCDVKFSGGNFSRWLNRTYADKVSCLAVEFKKIFMDEWSGSRNIGATRELQELFHQAVMAWLPEYLAS